MSELKILISRIKAFFHQIKYIMRREEYVNIITNHVYSLEAKNADLRAQLVVAAERMAAVVKNMCSCCTSEKWDRGYNPNCQECEWKEFHDKIFGSDHETDE